MVACVQVHVLHRCGQLRLLASAWGLLTSHHAQNLPLAGRRWLPTGLPSMSALRRMQGLVPETGGFEALSHPARKVWCRKCQASLGKESMPPDELQESLWREFFLDPTRWSDNRRRKPTPGHPDFRHTKSNSRLWLNNQHKPAWVDSQLAWWDAGMKTHPVSTSVEGQGDLGRLGAHECQLDVGMCRKLCDDGRITEAVHALSLLVQRGCHLPTNLFYHVLKRCIAHKDLVLGTRVHALTIKSGYEGHAYLATHLIVLYASLERLDEAMRVFTKVSTPSSFNWATIVFAYARHGQAAVAIGLYRQMRESTSIEPTDHIYVAVLKACAAAGDLVAGKEVHADILASPGKANIFVQTGLVNMYAKCRSIVDARGIFDSLPEKNVVTWTAMIAGYAEQGMGQEALSLYSSMQQEGITPPNSVTYVCLLQACASVGVGSLDTGKFLHEQIEERGLHDHVDVGGSLVNMYAKCGSLEDARRVFHRLAEKNVVTWTAMIAGYNEQEMGQEALSLYSSMQQEGITIPNSVTFVCLLQACAIVGEGALHQGKELHAQIKERGLQDDVVVGGSLVNMYAKCGSLEDARRVFDRLPARNVITWNAMITGYSQQGMGQEALTLYGLMEQEGVTPPDSVTCVGLLQACASVAALALGQQLHALIEERGLQADPGVGPALVNMYAKCGSMFDSQQVFDLLPKRSIETWNALIGGYTRQGNSAIVFELLHRMRLEGIQPNGITFLVVLTACSHAGLVDKGQKYFEAMKTDYGISPTVEHYTCMLDLLGGAGHVKEALQMAKTMPFPADSAVWLTLLAACRKWNNIEIGQQAFDFAVSLDGKDAACYTLMSNIYGSAQMWAAAKKMQARRVKSGAWKKPGQSWWTDMDGVVHRYIVGEKKHPNSEGMYARLEQLVSK